MGSRFRHLVTDRYGTIYNYRDAMGDTRDYTQGDANGVSLGGNTSGYRYDSGISTYLSSQNKNKTTTVSSEEKKKNTVG